MKVRIKFAKYGVMKYIGHLDIMRYFQKSMRRAKVDIAYTSGFSPHQIMSFASPLGVGVESFGEYFDIELNSGNAREVKDALNRVMVPGMEIISVVGLAQGVKNAMASIAAASYRITMKEGFINEISDNSRVDEFLAQDKIKIIKQTKKNEIEFDLKPHIFEFSYDGEYRMLIDASSAGNIKPMAVIEEYARFCKEEITASKYQIIREEIYTVDENGKYVSLESVGEEF